MKSINVEVDELGKTYTLLIGNNKFENEEIIKASSPNDLWFHLDNVSSPFIILQTGGDKIPKRYLNYVGTLFRNYKNGLPSRYTVIYTEIGNVKLTNVMGTVIPTKLKYIKY